MTVLLRAHSITRRVARANIAAVNDMVFLRPILSTRKMVRTVPGNSAKVVQIKLTKSESVKLLKWGDTLRKCLKRKVNN